MQFFFTNKEIDSTKCYHVIIIRVAFRKARSVRTFSFINLLYVFNIKYYLDIWLTGQFLHN